MRRIAAIGLALLLPALASAQGRPRAGDMMRMEIAGHSGMIPLDSIAREYDMEVSRGAVFHAAAQVMRELGIKFEVSDSLRGAVGLANVVHRRRFAGQPISKWLDCGTGFMGLNADNWRVRITAFAFGIGTDPRHSTLKVAILAGGRDIAGNSTEEFPCASTGAFEKMFAERVRLRLANGLP